MKYQPLESGHLYHIFNKGNNRETIFKEPKNYIYFLSLIKKYLLNDMELFAYCLMPNHFHFVLKINESSKNPSRLLSNLFNAYSKSINKMYNREGSLFKDRFSRKKVEDEIYLKKLIIYVHTNPLHHGFDEPFNQYKYSSYKSYIENDAYLVKFENIKDLFFDLDNFEYCHHEKEMQQSYQFEE
ncbi:MAG: transposase [Flavobacteriaceae bacterium]|nr:transposase [Flavobacteriaceae bacterium]